MEIKVDEVTFAELIQAHDAFERGHALKKKQALSMVENLRNDPSNLDDRFAILAYLTRHHFQGKDVENIRAKRAEIIFWLIENVPHHAGLRQPECMILFEMDPHYEEFKQLWEDQVKKHPSNAAVLGNAGEAFLVEDGELAEKLLIEAERLAPMEPEWPHMLSLVYEFRAKASSNKADKKRWKSLSIETMDRCKVLRMNRIMLHVELKSSGKQNQQ